jgi:hypothetical protein
MTIWVDGDSAPRDIRPILLRCGKSIAVHFIASRKLSDLPESMLTLVPEGQDSADLLIEKKAALGDLVVTRDILFAERLVKSGIAVINDRGELFTKEKITERRSLRDTAAELRFQGLAPASPKGSQRTAKETKRFADGLDRALATLRKKND